MSMSAVAAHPAYAPSAADRRYGHELAAHAHAHYDPATFFSYSQPSLNAVTASAAALDPSYNSPSSSYPWDASFQTSSSSSLANDPAAFAPSASSGPPSLSNLGATYADYSAHRPALPARSSAHYHIPHHPQPASPASTHSSTISSPTSRSPYSSSSRGYSSLAAANASHSATSSAARLQHATWDSSCLYTIDPCDPVHTPLSPLSPLTSPPSTPIKTEDPDGGLVIEVSVPAQPVSGAMPEVPLRATHAVPEMKRMMYAFRLENFAMHDGIKSAAVQPGSGGIEVGPLKEQPVELEWQVQLDAPLVADEEEDAFRYPTAPRAQGKTAARPSTLYRQDTPVSPRQTGRGGYVSMGSASPASSLDYPSAVENDAWDASSGYGSVAGTSARSGPPSTSSPSFPSVMTPAQSLNWDYQPGEASIPPSTYRRQPQPSGQRSLSRVSQTHGQYLLSGSSSSKVVYPQASQYNGYESSGYPRHTSSSRYGGDVYAASSAGSWLVKCGVTPHTERKFFFLAHI
ncbi:hypothetical protein BD310DRAFT_826045 [Dichomitus squalens]|uniref:Uncharacterized protein n=1 Tax=Dichomitus squalens TaxID=114155 RepID=A0A4V2K7A2_9APHY|nr:hypothetical protein BD310DRAFT_826045 [Dichomitus squalens]